MRENEILHSQDKISDSTKNTFVLFLSHSKMTSIFRKRERCFKINLAVPL